MNIFSRRPGLGSLPALALALLAWAPTGWTQTWPTKAVTIVSPYPAGGITDQLCRIVADELTKSLGQPVLVENRLGAGGAIAMSTVAKGAADGHTLVMGGSAVSTILPALNPAITYDPIKDFEPIGYVAALPVVLVAHSSMPATLKDFMAQARAHPEQLNCAHHGTGTGTHLACLQFARKLGVVIADIPYKGAPQVNQDLVTNRVQFYFGTLPTEVQLIRSGQLRAYGIASDQRASITPEIPTLSEQGLTGLNLDSWNALYAPAATPRPVLARLQSDVARALQNPEVRKRIDATGSVMRAGNADDLRRLTQDELDHYRKLAADSNVRLSN